MSSQECCMETAELVGFSTDDDGVLGTHWCCCCCYWPIWRRFKSCSRSLCLCLIIFYHAAYLVGWAQHPCFSCWSDWLWFKGSSEVTFVVFNSLLLCLLTSIVMDFFWQHALYFLWKVLVVVLQFVGSHTQTHIAADLFGASSEAAAEVILNLSTNNAFETELPMYNICDTWWLWKDLLNKNSLCPF